eukprot:12046582-Alexandrium_andersonii.AAC.1
MSASLVGSEMCIRDRARSSQLHAKGSGLKACGSRRKAQGPRLSADCWPVSYTHLTLPTICSV